MMQTVAFMLALAILGAFIVLISLISSAIQQWISYERRDTSDREDSPGNQPSDRDQLQPKRAAATIGARIDAVADAIHTYRHKRESHERRHSKNEKITIVVLGATGIFALLAALAAGISDWIFYRQLIDARVASNDTRDYFKSRERPIIWLEKETPKYYFVPIGNDGNGYVMWPFHYQNFGAGIAKGGTIRLFIQIRDGPPIPSASNANSVMAPMPPGYGLIAHVQTPTISRADFDELRHTQWGMKAYMLVEYTGVAGDVYRSLICEGNLASGDESVCPDAKIQ